MYLLLVQYQSLVLQHSCNNEACLQSTASWQCCVQDQETGTLNVSTLDLNSEEVEAFDAAVTAGKLSSLVTEWQPWGLGQDASELRLDDRGQQRVQGKTRHFEGACEMIMTLTDTLQVKCLSHRVQPPAFFLCV